MYAEETLAFCAGQCQASRFPPASCRCICQGRNHGVLFRGNGRTINVTPQTHDQRYDNWMRRFEEPTPIPQIAPLKQLPHIQPEPVQTVKPKDTRPFHQRHTLASRVARSLKTAVSGYSQDDLNGMIIRGLKAQFNQQNTDLAIDQAFTIRQSKQPDANRPELYELYETGEIDQALAMMGKRWVIGRPKVKR